MKASFEGVNFTERTLSAVLSDSRHSVDPCIVKIRDTKVVIVTTRTRLISLVR